MYGRRRRSAASEPAFDDLLALAHAGLVEAATRYDDALAANALAANPLAANPLAANPLAANPLARNALAVDGPRGAASAVRTSGAASFATFAWYRIRGAMLDGLRRSAAGDRARRLPIDDLRAAGLAAAAEPTRLPPDAFDQARAAARVRAAVAQLPDASRAIVTKHYFEGKTLLAAGAELGLSKSWASRLHARAVTQLRAVLGAERDA